MLPLTRYYLIFRCKNLREVQQAQPSRGPMARKWLCLSRVHPKAGLRTHTSTQHHHDLILKHVGHQLGDVVQIAVVCAVFRIEIIVVIHLQ